jgi:type IX secretion system PorP/SprF family membrane protein
MDSKRMILSFLVLFFILSFKMANGQQVPLNPVSYRIFNPFIFNPAMAGSKDFLSIDLIAGVQGDANSQVLSGNTRITKKVPDYLVSPGITEFTNIGVGGYIFNDYTGSSSNIGAGATASYHLSLDRQHLSFLSFGASVKGVSYKRDSISSTEPLLSQTSKSASYPNVDVGAYYYSPTLFAGISVTNLLGNTEEPDTNGVYDIPVSRQYTLQAGYKILLSRSLKIVLEPSLIVNSDGTSSQEIKDILEPMLKLYLDNFCFGTYFSDFDKTSVFFQYKYPRISIGTFFQLPKDSPYYQKALIAEFTLGINLSKFAGHNHW